VKRFLHRERWWDTAKVLRQNWFCCSPLRVRRDGDNLVLSFGWAKERR